MAGFKCEGKSTFFQRTAICEGALQNFIKKGFKTPEGKLIKSTKAYGCLGTSIGISFNSSSDTAYANGFKPADASAVEAILAGNQFVLMLSGQQANLLGKHTVPAQHFVRLLY